jgi:hypothetical protein
MRLANEKYQSQGESKMTTRRTIANLRGMLQESEEGIDQ